MFTGTSGNATELEIPTRTHQNKCMHNSVKEQSQKRQKKTGELKVKAGNQHY